MNDERSKKITWFYSGEAGRYIPAQKGPKGLRVCDNLPVDTQPETLVKSGSFVPR